MSNDKRNVTNFSLFLIKYGEIFFCFFLSSFSWYLNMDIDIDLSIIENLLHRFLDSKLLNNHLNMGEWHWNMYNIIHEMNCQSRFDAGYRMLGAGALGGPRGMVRGGRWERGSGWGPHVHLWRIHVKYGKTNTIL